MRCYCWLGRLISGSGLYEWLRLMTAVMVRMDGGAKARPMGMVLLGFFVRLGLTVVLLYVSLKVLNGSVYALAGGLALGVFALSVEGLRLMKAWTVLDRAFGPRLMTEILCVCRHRLYLPRFLNAHFAAPVTALLEAVHVHPKYPQAPISNAFAMELLVVGLLLAYFIVVRLTLSVEKPNGVAAPG